jgi:hypothetical protein
MSLSCTGCAGVRSPRSCIRWRAIPNRSRHQARARRSSGANTRSSTSFAKCTAHIETLRWSAAEVRQRAQLRSASSMGFRPGRVSSMATDPPSPFRPTTWRHISSSEPHILESAVRGISSICVSGAVIMLSGPRKAIHSRGRLNRVVPSEHASGGIGHRNCGSRASRAEGPRSEYLSWTNGVLSLNDPASKETLRPQNLWISAAFVLWVIAVTRRPVARTDT